MEKYDKQLEEEVQQWVEGVLQEPFPEGQTFAESLKDGTRLCRVLNTIQPGSIKKYNQSANMNMFKQMENISIFLTACRGLGVPSFDCFETNDLFQEKNMKGVLRCLDSLGRTVQKKCPDFKGPHLGAKMSTRNERNFDPSLLNKGVVNKLNMGSAHTMERKTCDFAASVTFGEMHAGRSATDAPTFLTTGDATVAVCVRDEMTSPTPITLAAVPDAATDAVEEQKEEEEMVDHLAHHM